MKFEGLKIKRTFGILYGLSFYGVGIYHRCSDITVAQKLLNGADDVVGLQQMTGKTVPKRMG